METELYERLAEASALKNETQLLRDRIRELETDNNKLYSDMKLRNSQIARLVEQNKLLLDAIPGAYFTIWGGKEILCRKGRELIWGEAAV